MESVIKYFYIFPTCYFVCILWAQLVKKFPTFYTAQSFITIFTIMCHLSRFWTGWIKSQFCATLTLKIKIKGHEKCKENKLKRTQWNKVEEDGMRLSKKTNVNMRYKHTHSSRIRNYLKSFSSVFRLCCDCHVFWILHQ